MNRQIEQSPRPRTLSGGLRGPRLLAARAAWVLVLLLGSEITAAGAPILFDMEAINRTLVYGSLTATLVLVCVGGVASLRYVLRELTDQGSRPAAVDSTLAIAALLGPLRRRIQSFVDRRSYRKKYDAARTLEALGDDPVTAARDTVQPAHGSLWLGAPEHGGTVE